ncbi:MAG: succinate dehydrogenase [Planctomycetaceae bacterium]|nr:succinate dehydrogenase [Planctomycetaceae bacterium]
MQISDCASVFGRHEFLIRRLHSLSGLVPIGGYLAFHLATNAAILDGVAAYQHRADQIHRLGPTTILVLEWSLIFLPILFHGIVGMLIVCRGKRNLSQYPYTGNFRYTLQRATGVIAMLFILWHVFHMHGWFRWQWWVEGVARPLGGAQFNPAAAVTAPEVLQSSWVLVVLYAIGTLACVYHLANGIWTMGITWGVWTSPRAQRMANIPCMLGGLILAVVGMGALYGMCIADTSAVPAGGERPAHSHASFEPGEETVPGGIELTEEGRI